MTLMCVKEGSDEIIGSNVLYVNKVDDTIFADLKSAVNRNIFFIRMKFLKKS